MFDSSLRSHRRHHRHFAPNKREGESTQGNSEGVGNFEGVNLRRLITILDLRSQVISLTIAALLSTSNDDCIITDMAGVLFSTSAELSPWSQYPREPQS